MAKSQMRNNREKKKPKQDKNKKKGVEARRLPACTARLNSAPRTRANTARSTSWRCDLGPHRCSFAGLLVLAEKLIISAS